MAAVSGGGDLCPPGGPRSPPASVGLGLHRGEAWVRGEEGPAAQGEGPRGPRQSGNWRPGWEAGAGLSPLLLPHPVFRAGGRGGGGEDQPTLSSYHTLFKVPMGTGVRATLPRESPGLLGRCTFCCCRSRVALRLGRSHSSRMLVPLVLAPGSHFESLGWGKGGC